MFLDNLKKNIKLLNRNSYYCGFYFTENKYYFIELKKVGSYYLPTYHKIFESSEFISSDGFFLTKEAINIFKELTKIVHTNHLNISELENKKLQLNFISALNIAGFKKINIKQNNLESILPLIIKTKQQFSRYPENKKIFNAFFTDKKIHFILTKNSQIINQTVVNSNILDYDSIVNFLEKNKLDEPEVYISGEINLNLENIKEMFYITGLKTHTTNVWQNITDTKKLIPQIFFLDSHKFISVLGIALPSLPPILTESISPKSTEGEKINKTYHNFNLKELSSFKKNQQKIEKKSEKNKKNIQPKINFIKKLENYWDQEIKFINKFDKTISINFLKRKEKKSEKKVQVKSNQKNKKIFLPKKKIKLFLPKNKKLTELKVFKAAKVFYLEKIKTSSSSPDEKNKKQKKKKINWIKKMENFWDQKIF